MINMTAYPVAIHRLTVLARSAQQTQVDTLQQALNHMVWPQADDDQWVFIQRMQVRGTQQQLPRRLLEQTKYLLNQVDNSEEVMRFDNLEELLTALLHDVLDGKAGLRWYWQNWAHLFSVSTSQAVQQILSDHLIRLSSLTAKLAQRGDLKKVWQHLDESSSRQLAIELSHLSGFRLPASWEIVRAYTQQAEQFQQTNDQTVVWTQVPLLTTGQLESRMTEIRMKQWRFVLKDLDLSDGRFLLALMLIGQETMPLLMQKRPVQLLAALASCFSVQTLNRSSLPEGKTSEQYLPEHEKNSYGRIASLDAEQSTQAMSQEDLFSMNEMLRPDSAERSGRIAMSALPKTESQVSDQGLGVKEVADTEDFHQSVKAAELPGAPGGEGNTPLTWRFENQSAQGGGHVAWAHFYTTQGGLLYLLNMLNRTEMLTLMQSQAEQLPSGWLWLYRLGQELQLREDDPLVDFIALQLGLDSRDERAQLPALPVRDQVLRLAQQWYGKTDVWHADLLALSAEVRCTPSHIDMYAAMTAIRLPVRLAGLDINPGWLPWLGRVVNFHYD